MEYYVDFPNETRVKVDCELQVGDIVYYHDAKTEQEAKITYRWIDCTSNEMIFASVEFVWIDD